ncbi:MAG: hypothetical protein QFX38_00270 [Methanothermobacter sp.]|nr:hypothetical protein [Methanothermobacter sp.]
MANVHFIKKYKNQIYTCFTKIIVRSPDVGIFKISRKIFAHRECYCWGLESIPGIAELKYSNILRSLIKFDNPPKFYNLKKFKLNS